MIFTPKDVNVETYQHDGKTGVTITHQKTGISVSMHKYKNLQHNKMAALLRLSDEYDKNYPAGTNYEND